MQIGMLWDVIRKKSESIQKLQLVAVLAVGFGLSRRWLGIVLGALPEGDVFSDMFINLSNPLINCLLFLLIPLVAQRLKITPLFKRGICVFGAFGSLFVGAAMILFGGPNVVLYSVGTIVLAFGFALAYLLWLEISACLEPALMVLTFTGSMLVNGLVWLNCQGLAMENRAVFVLLLPVIGVPFILSALQRIPQNRVPEPGSLTDLRPFWQLIVWVAALGLAFGAGDAITASAISTNVSYIGRLIPALIIFLGILLLPNRFDINVIYWLSLFLILFGFVGAMFAPAAREGLGTRGFAQGCMSACMETYLLLAFVIACGSAYRNRTSPVLLCGVIFAAQAAAVAIGRAFIRFLSAAGLMTGAPRIAAVAVIIAIILAAYLFCFNEKVFSRQWGVRAISNMDKANGSAEDMPENASGNSSVPSREMLADIAAQKKLSAQETNVFVLFAEGMTPAEISSELFVAQGTTRSHISRIYKKFDVHSREEMDAAIEQMTR